MKNLKFGVFCLGLALAIGTVVTSLAAQDRVERAPRGDMWVLDGRGAQLGVMVSDVDAKSTTGGAKIDEVNPGSPAEKAGIRAGDVVVEYDSERVRSARQFTRLVQETPEGRAVPVALVRDGKRQVVTAMPETSRMTWNFGGPELDRAFREAERGFSFDVPAPYRDFHFDDRERIPGEPRRFEYRLPEEFHGFAYPAPRGRLGVSVQSITPELAEYFGSKNGGALVSSVTKESAAAKAGIKAGDVIVSVNGRAVSDAEDLINKIEDVDGDVTIVVLRDKKEMTLKATIDR